MTELEKEAAQRLEKIKINSSYYRLAVFDLLDVYGEKDVNAFCTEHKLKLYWEKQNKILEPKTKTNFG